MARIVIIGNAGAGKSTLARIIARQRRIDHVEIDRLLWQPGWISTPDAVYDRQHSDLIASEDWVIDGLGKQASIRSRMERASEIVLVDMPLWMHFWLAAERQLEWSRGTLQHAPGNLAEMPPTKALFEAIWEVDRSWMPDIRSMCAEAEQAAKPVIRLEDVEQLTRYGETMT